MVSYRLDDDLGALMMVDDLDLAKVFSRRIKQVFQSLNRSLMSTRDNEHYAKAVMCNVDPTCM